MARGPLLLLQLVLLLLLLLLQLPQRARAIEYEQQGDDDQFGPKKEEDRECECEDEEGWNNGGISGMNGWAGCESYAEGEVNEGRCAADGASKACPQTCDTCPECPYNDVPAAMLWVGLPCMGALLTLPALKHCWVSRNSAGVVVKEKPDEKPEDEPDGAVP